MTKLGDPTCRGHVNAVRVSRLGQQRFAVTGGSARRATSAEPRTDGHFARPSLCFSLDLKDSDKAAGKDDAWESCGVMGHHDVERMPVIGFRRWHEPPVMGIGQSGEE
jgi:hypothetical protein